MLKYSKTCEGADDLQEALTSILGILKAVNDSMHLIAITGYEVKQRRADRWFDVVLTSPCCAVMSDTLGTSNPLLFPGQPERVG